MARPTLMTLARELGVSRQTVSNVINAPHLVKKETRERVQKHIHESGYRPSAAARTLRTSRSHVVGMRFAPVTDGINGAIMDRFVHALCETLMERQYHILLFPAAGEHDEMAALSSLFESSMIDGAILAYVDAGDTRPDQLQRLGVPFVAFGRPWLQPKAKHAWVDVDNAMGVEEATTILRSRGHTKIGFIGWGEQSNVGQERKAGWVRGMQGADVDVRRLAVAVPDGIREGSQAMGELIESGATAAVCASDSLAIGATSRLRGTPPDGFDPNGAVFGFDDSPVAAALGLSSVAQPIEEVAAALVNQLMAELDGSKARVPRQVLLPSAARPRDAQPFPLNFA